MSPGRGTSPAPRGPQDAPHRQFGDNQRDVPVAALGAAAPTSSRRTSAGIAATALPNTAATAAKTSGAAALPWSAERRCRLVPAAGTMVGVSTASTVHARKTVRNSAGALTGHHPPAALREPGRRSAPLRPSPGGRATRRALALGRRGS